MRLDLAVVIETNLADDLIIRQRTRVAVGGGFALILMDNVKGKGGAVQLAIGNLRINHLAGPASRGKFAGQRRSVRF